MMQPIERVIANPTGQVARRLIGKLLGDEMQAEMNIQMRRMERAARAMYAKLQAAQVTAERRIHVLIAVGRTLDCGDLEFDERGVPQIRRDIKKAKKDDLKTELEAAWDLIERLYARQIEVNQMIEDEILWTGSEKQ